MTSKTVAGVEVSDGDRIRVTFETPFRRSIGGRIPLEGTVEKTIEGTANVMEPITTIGGPTFTFETDDGDKHRIHRASEFYRIEWDDGERKRLSMDEETDVSGWVVGKEDDRASRDDVYSTRQHIPVGVEPDIEIVAPAADA